MSRGSLIGGALGGIGGFLIGGPVGALYGAQIGFGLGMMIDPIKPDIPVAGKQDTSELTINTANEGVSIPEVLGSPKVIGNIIGYWNSRSEEQKEEVEGGKGGGGSQTVTTGYKYYLTWLLGICSGPVDTVYAIYRNDECIWEGELDCPGSGGEQTIVIEDLGSVTIYFGTDDQTINTTIQGLVEDSTLVPAYRYLCCAFFDDCFIGEYNRLPTFKFVVKRIPEYDFSTNSRQQIETFDYNPVHALYHILYGLVDLPSSFINEDSFDLASEQIYCEGLGITMVMDRQSEAIQYIEQIIYHIGAVLRFEYTAELYLKLLRKNKLIGLLPTINEDVMLDDLVFGRDSWLNTVNDVRIQHPLRYFMPEVHGEEYVGLNSCSGSITLTYLGCIEEAYQFGDQAGEYSISEGGGFYFLYYKTDGMDDFVPVKAFFGLEFTYLCRSIVCAGEAETRQIKIWDVNCKVWSNTLNIDVTEAPDFDFVAGDYEMDPDDSLLISVSGGKPNYYWTINGDGNLWFDAAHTIQEIETYDPSVTVYSGDEEEIGPSDVTVTITVNDGCASLALQTIDILSCCSALPSGELSIDEDSTPDVISKGGSINVYIEGGCPPFTWSASGSGYSFDESETTERVNVLNCDSGNCGINYDPYTTITVTDKCGSVAQGQNQVREVNGQWIECLNTGEETCNTQQAACDGPGGYLTIGAHRIYHIACEDSRGCGTSDYVYLGTCAFDGWQFSFEGVNCFKDHCTYVHHLRRAHIWHWYC